MEYKITGIILSHTLIEDTDVLVSIYSREKGKLSALYKKAKKRDDVMASLEIFNENDFVLSERKIWDAVYSIDIKTTFYNIRGNYEAFLAAAYFAKTVDRLTPKNNPTPELYELLRSVFLMLDNGQNPDNVREYFHVNTLKIEGLLSEHKIAVTADEFERVISEYTNTNSGG